MLHVVLYQPEIPQNTGNIGRTCSAIDATLHLIRPLGFELTEKRLRRAGLDYWRYVRYVIHDDWSAFVDANPDLPIFFLSTKGTQRYTDCRFPAQCALCFGRETAGLPQEMLDAHRDRVFRIPMHTQARSLNLANTVAIVGYEWQRQMGFAGLV